MTLFILLLAVLAAQVQPDSEPKLEKVESSNCHAYIDFDIIWTLELVQEFGQPTVPILNIVTFEIEEAPLKPEQIHIYDAAGRTAKINRFAIDTGFEPYETNFLQVLASSFIGLDLQGDFDGFSPAQRVSIELGDKEFELQAVDCLDYEMLADRINKINYESPDIKQDFAVLHIPHIGTQKPRRRGRR